MTLPLPDEMSDPWVYLQNNPEPPTNSWVVHGLECDDGHKLPPTELVRLVDLEEERKSSIALMKLLADEKHKSEALATDLARCRAANVYDGTAHKRVADLEECCQKQEADAKRYRWLRDNSDASNGLPFIARYQGSFSRWTGVAADGVVDIAMTEKETKGEQG